MMDQKLLAKRYAMIWQEITKWIIRKLKPMLELEILMLKLEIMTLKLEIMMLKLEIMMTFN